MDKKQKSKSQIICDAVCGILMIVATIAYLLVGFLTQIWHPTWLIFVVTALVSAIIGIISNTSTDLKNLPKNNTDSENK